jgi:hypothetical protein
VAERRKIFCKLEDIQMERGSIGLAWWRNKWYMVSNRVKGVEPNPTLYMTFNNVWLDAYGDLEIRTSSGIFKTVLSSARGIPDVFSGIPARGAQIFYPAVLIH